MGKSLIELNKPLKVRELFEAKSREWELELIAGREGLDAVICTPELNRPGLALAGYYDVFSSDRIQLIGLTESSYLRSMFPGHRIRAIERTLGFAIPCIIVTTGQEICEELLKVCNERNIVLLRTSHNTSYFQADLAHYLERRLAPSWNIHGVMMDVFGIGVLIQGVSGVGKSECGLELIERGHRLIADDVVVVRRIDQNELIAETPANIGYHMEIRGIGIIDVELLYGVRAVREEAKISLTVKLEPWDPSKEYERLGLEDRTTTLFDCRIPEYILPVEPGRNIAKLVEVAALDHRLEEQGINVAQEFDKRIRDVIRGKTPSLRRFSALDRLYGREEESPGEGI
jgi:HPr kinase/phosphorylase